MVLIYRTIKKEVHKKMRKKTVDALVSHIKKIHKKKKINLWGLNKGKGFLEKCIYVALFKECTSKGYTHIKNEISDWAGFSEKTLSHNQKSLRALFTDWGKKQINLESKKEWNQCNSCSEISKEVKDANLLLDSVDFSKEGKKQFSRKDSEWSYKCNSPGQRYMVLQNLNGKILRVWGGYSPKLHDSAWLKMNKEWINDNLKGGVVLADCHFSYARDRWKKVKFYVPFYETKSKKKKKLTH